MTAVVLIVSLVLAVVAVAGIMRPFHRGGRPALERLSDPLEDERTALLRTLRDLEDDRRSDALSEQEYVALRSETERRAVVVLRALEARDGDGSLADGVREIRSIVETDHAGAEAGVPNEPPAGAARRRLVPAALGAVLALGVVPLLVNAVSAREPGGSLSGDTGIAGTAPSSTPTADPAIAPLVRRVQQHPADLAARLDLAAAYVHEHRTGLAALQYTEVLRRDKANPEANTGLAVILAAAGRAPDALYLVDRALASDPHDPEALFQRGVILLNGLHRPTDAAAAFRAYLAAAPFGTHRAEARRLLNAATATPSAPSPGPTAAASGSP